MNCFRCKELISNLKYCKYCFSFSKFNNDMIPQYKKRSNYTALINLRYNLTPQQQEVSSKISKSKKDVVINAVCGAGKTEIVLNEIQTFLRSKKRVGFLIPRIEIAREIFYKLKNFFPKNSISFAYGSKKAILSDIVVATCHSAHKFINNLDLVIIDEVDAFPLNENQVLQKICFNLARDKTIYLSATPPSYLPKNINLYNLNKRFHNKKIPTPKITKVFLPQSYLKKVLSKNTKPLFVFFPTIRIQNKYYEIFKKHFNIKLINSKLKTNQQTLQEFKNQKSGIIFTTSVLERGVTYHDLNVIVMFANHVLYSVEQLIQISGRVGRTFKNPQGQILFICYEKSQKLKEVINVIKEKNRMSDLF